MMHAMKGAIREQVRAHALAHFGRRDARGKAPLAADEMKARGLDDVAAAMAVTNTEALALAYVGEMVSAAQGAAGPWPGSAGALEAAGARPEVARAANELAAEVWAEMALVMNEERSRLAARLQPPRGLRGLLGRLLG